MRWLGGLLALGAGISALSVLLVPLMVLAIFAIAFEAIRDFWPWLIAILLAAIIGAVLSRFAKVAGVTLAMIGAVIAGILAFLKFGHYTGFFAGVFVAVAIAGPAIAAAGATWLGIVATAQTFWTGPFFVAGYWGRIDNAHHGGDGLLAIVVGLLGAAGMMYLAAEVD